MYRIFQFVALSVALAVAAAAAATAQPAPFTINVVLSLSGPAANYGRDAATSLAALEKFVNRTGGIRGRPVHFQISDDQSSPAVAVQLFQQLLTTHPAVVLGPSVSAPAQAMSALVTSDGPVLYTLTPNLLPKPHGFVFAASVKTSASFSAIVRNYIMRGFTKLGIIATTDASGQSNLNAIKEQLSLPENKALKIVDVETFAVDDVSMAAQAARLKASGAQAIADYSEGTAFGTSLRALNDIGLQLPVYTPGSNFSPALLDQLKAILPKELDASGLSYVERERQAGDPQKKPIDDFYAALAADGITQPTSTYAHAWDPAMIVVSVLRSLGTSATAVQIHTAIENLHDFPGVEGIYDFRSGDQHGVGTDALLIVRNDPNHPGHTIISSKQGGAPL